MNRSRLLSLWPRLASTTGLGVLLLGALGNRASAQAVNFVAETADLGGTFGTVDRAVAGPTYDVNVDAVFATDTGALALYGPGRYGAHGVFATSVSDLELLPATPVMKPRVFSVGAGAVYDWVAGPDGFAPTPMTWGSVAGAVQISAGRVDLDGNFRQLAIRCSPTTVKLGVFDRFMAPLGSWCEVAIDPTAEDTVLYQAVEGAFPILTTQAGDRLIAQDCTVPIDPLPLAVTNGFFPSARHTRLEGGTFVAWMTPMGNTDQLQLFDGTTMALGSTIALPPGLDGVGLAAGQLDDDLETEEVCVLTQSASGTALQLYRRVPRTAELEELAQLQAPGGLVFTAGTPVVADFDGDGDDDILAVHTDGNHRQSVLWRNGRIDHDQRRVDLAPVGNGEITVDIQGDQAVLSLPLTIPAGAYSYDELTVIVWTAVAPDWGSTETPLFEEHAAHHFGIPVSGASATVSLPIDAGLIPFGGSDAGLFLELRLVNSATGHEYPSRVMAVSSAVLDDRSWMWSSFGRRGGGETRPVQTGRPIKQVGSIRILDFPIRPPSGKRPKPGPKTTPPQ